MKRKIRIASRVLSASAAGAALFMIALAQSPAAKGQVKKPGQRLPGVYVPQPKIYKTFSEEFFLTPGEGMELKFHMAKGAVMVYAWKADGKLGFEMHGQPDKLPSKDYYDSYKLDDKVGTDSFYGSFTSPKTGIHGWYFVNNGSKAINFRLMAAGFFDAAKLFAGGDPEEMPVEDAK